jgi:hypothetical protein
MNTNRRDFLKTSAIGSAGIISGLGLSAKGFAASKGANDKIRIGIIGFSGRARHSLIPSFYHHADELNFEMYRIFGTKDGTKQSSFSKKNMVLMSVLHAITKNYTRNTSRTL